MTKDTMRPMTTYRALSPTETTRDRLMDLSSDVAHFRGWLVNQPRQTQVCGSTAGGWATSPLLVWLCDATDLAVTVDDLDIRVEDDPATSVPTPVWMRRFQAHVGRQSPRSLSVEACRAVLARLDL